jgi:hypothetical protein
MPDMIRDGKGNGFLAEVDSENRIQAACTTETALAHRSYYDGSAYGISTPMLTITTTGGRMLWIKNNSSTPFWFTDFWFNWNGGTTNHNRVMYGQLVFADTEPDTNVTVGGAGVLNRSKTSAANMSVLYWDEVGDGLTGHDAGTPAFFWCNGQGSQHYSTDGAIIIGVNKTLSVNLQGEEVGEASINILGFFK